MILLNTLKCLSGESIAEAISWKYNQFLKSAPIYLKLIIFFSEQAGDNPVAGCQCLLIHGTDKIGLS